MSRQRDARLTVDGALTLALLLGALLAPAGCRAKDAAKETPPVAVELEKVTTGDITPPFVLFGRTEAEADAQLSFQVAGVVSQVPVREGDYVKKGTLLAALDKESLKLSVDLSRAQFHQAAVTYKKFRGGYRSETIKQAYAQYTQAQAVLQKAKTDWESGQRLHKSGTISRAQWQGYKTTYESAKAAVEQARQGYLMRLRGYERADVTAAGVQTSQAKTRLLMAKKQLRDAQLLAPFSGVVARKRIEVGELVSAQRLAFELVDISKLRIKVGVPERIIDSVQVGQTAFISVAAENQPLLHRMIIGKIDTRGVTLDPKTMTYPVSITIRNPIVKQDPKRPTYKMLPGKVVRILLFDKERKRGITVPLSAILNDGKQAFVYVNDKRRAKKVLVNPQRTHTNRIVVTGLSEGAEVVVKGQHQLSPGRRLFITRSTVASKGL